MKNKKEIQLKQLRREVAQLLESGHDQTARIRVCFNFHHFMFNFVPIVCLIM